MFPSPTTQASITQVTADLAIKSDTAARLVAANSALAAAQAAQVTAASADAAAQATLAEDTQTLYAAIAQDTGVAPVLPLPVVAVPAS